MKDMNEVYVILGIILTKDDNGIILTQSHYIEKLLKKFNHYYNCISISTQFHPSIKLTKNKGKPISQLEYAK